MAVLNQNIPDDLMGRFYDVARRKFGDKKGCKRQALIEAMEGWLRQEKAGFKTATKQKE
jgi:hypothetical protein